MEKFYNVLKNIKNKDHRLSRKEYFLTILLYNLLVHVTVGILINSYNTIITGPNSSWDPIDQWTIASYITTILCIPLYSSQYHRLKDTGLNTKISVAFPIIGFILKIARLCLNYSSTALFGMHTLSLLGTSYLSDDTQNYHFIAIFMLIESIYMLINFILIITKTDQFKKQ